jgi:hypothetical protein
VNWLDDTFQGSDVSDATEAVRNETPFLVDHFSFHFKTGNLSIHLKMISSKVVKDEAWTKMKQ